MNKLANTPRPLSPEERLIASYMAGGGLYSALQLKNQVFSPDEKPDEDVLKVKIPREKLLSFDKKSAVNNEYADFMNAHTPDLNHALEGVARSKFGKPLHQLSDDEWSSAYIDAANKVSAKHGRIKQSADSTSSGLTGNLHKMISTPAAIGLGGIAGFQHHSKMFEDMERKHLDGELAKAEKEYLDMLGQIKQSADSTPCVDAFCRGLIEVASSSPQEIDKIAKEDHDLADGSITRMLGNAASPITNLFKPVVDTAKGVTAAATLGSAAAVYLLKQKLEGSKSKSAPTRIEIEPV